jgi:chaperonin cofactor prefoldin|tara:strand:+ start:366 stop:554 length:189 start_codon:yes stop_codon:yes gene_type:complete
MKEADEAVNALRKLQELTDKYSNTEMDADQLRQSISERINASEELKDVMRRALEAKKRNEGR